MPATHRTRLVNPRLGTYFGIFISAFLSMLMLAIVAEQLGAPDLGLRWAIFIVPIGLYAAIGTAAQTQEPADFFAAGRRVPAFFTGLGIAATAIGGAGVVALPGLLMINGIDAWCIADGAIAGFVVCSVLIAPYIRKFGSYTLPGYLGRRFDSRTVRIVAASFLGLPLLLMIIAEFKVGIYAATWLTGASARTCALILAIAVLFTVGFGGLRAVTWAGTAAALAVMIALIVPAAIVGTEVTNFPLAQLSHGPTLRALERSENLAGVPIPKLSPMVFDLAGSGLDPLVRRMSRPFGSLGTASFILMTFTLMMGVAVAPWLMPRLGGTPGVYEARKSLGWAVFAFGLIALTASAIAVFQRDIIMNKLIVLTAASLPEWFQALVAQGHASVDSRAGQLTMSSFAFERDATMFLLPIATGMPAAIVYLALAGAVAVTFGAACASVTALAAIIAEDGINGSRWEAPADTPRLAVVRAAIILCVIVGAFFALALPGDPLMLVLWAVGLSGAAAFPVVVMSIWWKRINTLGAMAGMIAGFTVAVLLIVAGEANVFGIPSAIASIFAVPFGIIAAIIGTKLGPAPGRHVLEFVRDARIPGGETVHDREQRLLRLKRRQRPA